MQIKIETLVQDRMRIEYMAGSPEQAALFLNWVGSIGFPEAAPQAVVEAAPAPAPAPAEEITLEMCSQLAINLVNKKGRQAFTDLMSEFGVARLGELKKEDFAKVHAKLREATDE